MLWWQWLIFAAVVGILVDAEVSRICQAVVLVAKAKAGQEKPKETE